MLHRMGETRIKNEFSQYYYLLLLKGLLYLAIVAIVMVRDEKTTALHVGVSMDNFLPPALESFFGTSHTNGSFQVFKSAQSISHHVAQRKV